MVAAIAQAQAQQVDTMTEQASFTMTMSLLRAAIYSVTYIRGIFPEGAYETVNWLGMSIRKLKPSDDDTETGRLTCWIEKGIAHAVQRKFLKKAVFTISRTEADTSSDSCLEQYTFTFEYPVEADSGAAIGFASGVGATAPVARGVPSTMTVAKVKAQVCTFVRSLCTVMQTLETLPEDRYLSIRLYYYDSYTPPNYEPPYFKPCEPEDPGLVFTRKPFVIKLPRVESGHHKIALRVKSVEVTDAALADAPRAADREAACVGETVGYAADDGADDSDMEVDPRLAAPPPKSQPPPAFRPPPGEEDDGLISQPPPSADDDRAASLAARVGPAIRAHALKVLGAGCPLLDLNQLTAAVAGATLPLVSLVASQLEAEGAVILAGSAPFTTMALPLAQPPPAAPLAPAMAPASANAAEDADTDSEPPPPESVIPPAALALLKASGGSAVSRRALQASTGLPIAGAKALLESMASHGLVIAEGSKARGGRRGVSASQPTGAATCVTAVHTATSFLAVPAAIARYEAAAAVEAAMTAIRLSAPAPPAALSTPALRVQAMGTAPASVTTAPTVLVPGGAPKPAAVLPRTITPDTVLHHTQSGSALGQAVRERPASQRTGDGRPREDTTVDHAPSFPSSQESAGGATKRHKASVVTTPIRQRPASSVQSMDL